MDNLLFQDKNQSYTVKFDTKAYEQMLYYCAISNPYETGGHFNWKLFFQPSNSQHFANNTTTQKF